MPTLSTVAVQVAVVSDDPDLQRDLLACLQVDQTGLRFAFNTKACTQSALRSDAPDVVVIDCNMSGALRVCADLTSRERTGVVMVGVPEDGEAAVEALSAGAHGVVYKTQPLTDVARAVEAVDDGRVWAPRHVIVSAWMRSKGEATREQKPAEPDLARRLSNREREVFQHTAIGLGNREVAKRLSISEATVKVHLTHIFQKLGVRGRGELAAAYFRIIR